MIARLKANALRLGKEAQHLAGALSLSGFPAISLCCWCAETVPGEVIRLPKGGECVRCPYVGRDVLCVVEGATINFLPEDAHAG